MSFPQRPLAQRLRSAAKVFRGAEAPIVVFAVEGEARAWIAAQRARRGR